MKIEPKEPREQNLLLRKRISVKPIQLISGSYHHIPKILSCPKDKAYPKGEVIDMTENKTELS